MDPFKDNSGPFYGRRPSVFVCRRSLANIIADMKRSYMLEYVKRQLAGAWSDCVQNAPIEKKADPAVFKEAFQKPRSGGTTCVNLCIKFHR